MYACGQVCVCVYIIVTQQENVNDDDPMDRSGCLQTWCCSATASRSSAEVCLLPLRAPEIVALREQNAHIQRKVASGDGSEDSLEGSDAGQKVHGKVGLPLIFLSSLWFTIVYHAGYHLMTLYVNVEMVPYLPSLKVLWLVKQASLRTSTVSLL